jgi:YtcA family
MAAEINEDIAPSCSPIRGEICSLPQRGDCRLDLNQRHFSNMAIAMGSNALNRLSLTRQMCVTAIFSLLSGCDGAPSRNILGSYFPSWMLCAVAGIVLALLVRALLKSSGLLQELPLPFVVIMAIACAGTFAIWLIWLA